MKKLSVVAFVLLTSACSLAGEELLAQKWQGEEFVATTSARRHFDIALKPEWRVLRLRTAMKAKDIRRGKEGWMTGRLTFTFHDAKDKLVGPYPRQHECLGTTDWIPVDWEFLVPAGAVKARIGFVNIGVSGSVAFRKPSLEVVRNWITQPCNALPPPEAGADPESVADAERQTSAARVQICLNGLWRCRPALTNEAAAYVPGPGDNWGWGRIPAVWDKRTARLTSFVPAISMSPYFLDHPELLKAFAPRRAWYGRSFEMPAEAKGRRVALDFRMVNTRAVVYLDGKRAGEVGFPCGTVDLTALAKPGTRQFLAVDVTSWPLNATTLDFNAPDRAEKKQAVVRNQGITGDVFLQLTPRAQHITEAWVECDAEKGTATFVTEGVPDVARAVATVWPVGDDRRPIRFEGKGARFTCDWKDAKRWDTHTPQNRYFVRIALHDAAGALIDETTPFAFGFRSVRLAGRDLLLNGTPIHLRALYSPLMGLDDYECSKPVAQVACRRMLAEGFNFTIAGNYNFRAGSVSNIDGYLDACDETGMLFSFSLPHVRDFDVALDRPEVAARYRALTKKVMSLMRNHPSVITYAMNHNCTGYGGDQNPMRIDGKWYDAPEDDRVGDYKTRQNARRAGAIAKELDPTRPVYHHESGNLGDWITENIYLNWAPRQERSDWIEKWSEEGVKPLFFVEWGLPHVASWSSYRGPCFIWTSVGLMNYWAEEYAAGVLGDAAYDASPAIRRLLKAENDAWTKGRQFYYASGLVSQATNQYLGVQANFISDNWRAHRTYGITATLPWDQGEFFKSVRERHGRPERWFPENWRLLKTHGMHPPYVPYHWDDERYWEGLGDDAAFAPSATGEAFRRWNMPDLAYIGGAPAHTDKRHHYRPSERIEKQLVIVNDRRVDQTVSWRAALDGTVLKGTVAVKAGGKALVPVSFAAPKKPGAAQILAAFAFAGGVRQTDAFAIEVLVPPASAQKRLPLLYDPVGLTAAELKRLGIATVATDLSAMPSNRGERLIVGRGALTRTLLDTRLVPLMSRLGGRILVFEQEKTALEACGFRVQEYGLRQAFARYAKKGVPLTDSLLRDWAGASTLVPPCFTNTPPLERDTPSATWAGYVNRHVWRCGNRAAVATVIPEKPTLGDWRALADGGFDLQYAPLLEWRDGDGAILFCQLDVTARTVADPAAEDLVRRLVATMGDPLGASLWPVPKGLQAVRLGANRRVWGCFYHDEKKGDASQAKAYVLSRGFVAPPELVKNVEKGAVVLGLGLTKEEIRAICPDAPPMVTTNGCWYSRIERIPEELNGLSNADWAWHAAMDFDAFADKVADGNEAFRVVRRGKGKYVFMQVPPWTIDDTNRPNLRTTRRRAEWTLSRLLGNLGMKQWPFGIRYADVPEADDDPYRYIRW